MDSFKVWNENTTTSPEGRHLGLYKAWIHQIDDEEILPSTYLFGIIATLMNLAIKYNYPLRRWITIYNLYLLKEVGNFKIHRMRTIHIIDAELNLIRREIVTKWLIQNAEMWNHLNNIQYGGRKYKSAIDIPMTTTFTLDSLHLIRANTAFTDCDARACYDRIVNIVTGLAEQQAGLPPEFSFFLIKALKSMVYHMISAYGPGEKTNTHTKEEPIHGQGQGATDGPSGWTLTINPALDCYGRKCCGFTITSPDGQVSQIDPSKMFIDDKTLMHNNGRYDNNAIELMKLVDHDINLWNKYLNITGGLLEPLKSFYSVMVWAFQASGEPVLCKEEELPINTVKLRNNGIATTLKRVSEKKGNRMLGVRKALTLHKTTQIKYFKGITGKFGKAVVACPLEKHEAWLSYTTVYIPSLAYALPATTLIEKEIHELQAMLMPKLLPKCGYASNFPRAVIFGHPKFYGAGFYNGKALHLAMQIEQIVKHIRAGDPTGIVVRDLIIM